MSGTATAVRPTQHHAKCEHGACRSECPVLAWSRALYRTQPYREPSKPEEPLTDAEIAFWDAVYVSLIERNSSADAAKWSDRAVEQRRERYGVR